MNFERLRSLVEIATSQEGFYRRFYKMKDLDAPRSVSSWSEWRALPMLTKKDLLAVTLSERSLLPIPDIDHLFSSSGTTGTFPLFNPRTQLLEYEFRTRFYKPRGAALSSMPVPHQQERFLKERGLPPRVIVLDPRNPAISVALARAAGVEALFVFLHHVPLIAEHMKRIGIAKQIRYINTTGEVCTRSMYRYMADTFPNAVIVAQYGMSDIENSPMGVPCYPMSDREPLQVFHAKEDVFLELIDEHGDVIEPTSGAEGEVVITAYRGEPAAFPTIRYRTGDAARVIESACQEHGTWSFTIIGRIADDFVKIPGGMLKADEVERVMRLFPDRVSEAFELHVYGGKDSHYPVRIVLRVETRGDVDIALLASEISTHLRVSPSNTYADFAARKSVPSLICEPLLREEGRTGKRKRVVRHID